MADVVARLGAALSDRYRIERELGQGGMATVYQAHDVRHDRTVALKVLRPELAAILGAERFLQEIRTTANLQHPHILPLHDSGDVDGTVFYVMPYVEGESLRDRLAREKQLPVDDALRIAREVASALDYAHRHNVVHRDIKPENILLHDGQALVADFGIALAVSSAGGGTRMTETGMSLGTPHYMAPEQAMGDREITPRADIYALGVMLYEMLTGDPPFTGSTAQAIVARVVTESPRPLLPQRHTIPPHVEAAVLKALEKLPADRFASAAEFAAALGNTAFTAARPAAAAGAVRRNGRRTAVTVAAAALLVAAGMAAGLLVRRDAAPVIRYGLALPRAMAPLSAYRAIPSPDGSLLLYVGPSSNMQIQLWLKARDQELPVALAGTAGVWNATFSPDSRWIAFVQEINIRKVAVTGGAAITLADSAALSRAGIAWLDDGTIVYVGQGGATLRRVPATGGPSTVVFRTDSFTMTEVAPLPDGRGVLFARCGAGCGTRSLWVLDLARGRVHELVPGAFVGRWLPTGHILYARADGAAFVIPFNLRRLETNGTAIPVADSVAMDIAGLQIDVSRSGTLVLRSGAGGTAGLRYDLVWLDRTGRATAVDMAPVRLTSWGGGNFGLSLSPDGRRVALSLYTESGDDIWIKELPGGPLSRVTFDSTAEFRPRWLPDGRALSYIGVTAMGDLQLRRINADGTGEPTIMAQYPAGGLFEGEMSRDGRWIVARRAGGVGRSGRDIIGFRVGDTTAVPLVASQTFDESVPRVSPNGRWIAYESDETGRREVYIRPFPNTGAGKWQVSGNGGWAPLWSRDGRELFFVDVARQLTAVTLTEGAAPRFGERRPLFRLGDDVYLDEGTYYTPFDISPDGRRFLVVRRSESGQAAQSPLVITENWFTELRRLLKAR